MASEYRGSAPQEGRQPNPGEFDWKCGKIPESDVRYTASRGGGPGGQGVNTTDSRVELRWTIGESRHLSTEQKNTLRAYAKGEARKTILEESDELKFVCVTERSQLQNKRDCLNRLNAFLREALTPEEERIATKKSRGVKNKERHASEADKRRKSGRGKVRDWE
ncbi:aminoacyl-tRNA hydrolase [Patescibacteria group bacterium]|nr:MAG: aminoacyl-tRNA hydrolase [Patescibacteria group bacterium]